MGGYVVCIDALLGIAGGMLAVVLITYYKEGYSYLHSAKVHVHLGLLGIMMGVHLGCLRVIL